VADPQGNPTQILLFVSLAILVIVGGGWLLLGTESPQAPQPKPSDVRTEDAATAVDPATDDAAAESAAEVAPAVAEVLTDGSESTDDPAPQPTNETTDEPADQPIDESAAASDDAVRGNPQAPSSTVEADLRMARIAAEAGMLIEPPSQSALHFYSRVLARSPENEVARAELTAVLGQLNVQVSALLDAEDYEQAWEVARRVVGVDRDHDIVRVVQQVVEDRATELVAAAMAEAEQGNETAALDVLAGVEALPGRNPDYLQAVRESIADLVESYAEGQRQVQEEARQRAEEALAAWTSGVREAIGEGRLAGSGADNALQLLSASEADAETLETLRIEWLQAALAAASASVDEGELERAEDLITAAEDAGFDEEGLAELRSRLEDAFAARESARVVPMAELTAVNAAPAAFPSRASIRGISGQVLVEFTVDTDGTTRDIEITEAEPPGIFDNSALEAVAGWTFEPKVYRGEPIPQRTSARLVFRLDDA